MRGWGSDPPHQANSCCAYVGCCGQPGACDSCCAYARVVVIVVMLLLLLCVCVCSYSLRLDPHHTPFAAVKVSHGVKTATLLAKPLLRPVSQDGGCLQVLGAHTVALKVGFAVGQVLTAALDLCVRCAKLTSTKLASWALKCIHRTWHTRGVMLRRPLPGAAGILTSKDGRGCEAVDTRSGCAQSTPSSMLTLALLYLHCTCQK